MSLSKVGVIADGPPNHVSHNKPLKNKTKIVSKTITAKTTGNASMRRSINITEEALAIGKVPPEEIARMIAKG